MDSYAYWQSHSLLDDPMSVIKNARHEAFCQHIASGTMNISTAYVKAGFDANRSNASRLRQSIAIDRRIREIMTRRDRKITEKTSHEVETTRELILAELEEARQIAKKARNGSAMAMASLGKAKVLGLIIDRREIGEVGSFDNMTDEELVEQAKKRASALGLPAPSIN